MIIGDIVRTAGRALRPVSKAVIKGGIYLYRETGIDALITEVTEEERRPPRQQQRVSETPVDSNVHQRARASRIGQAEKPAQEKIIVSGDGRRRRRTSPAGNTSQTKAATEKKRVRRQRSTPVPKADVSQSRTEGR